jgi:hypothetical protein
MHHVDPRGTPRTYRQPAVDAAMATAAAPTFLKPNMTGSAVELVDGGVWANNPIDVAAIEAIGMLGWPLPDGRWWRRQGRRRLRVTYGPYVTQNRKEGPQVSTKSALRADVDAEDRENAGGRPKANGVRHAGRKAWS